MILQYWKKCNGILKWYCSITNYFIFQSPGLYVYELLELAYDVRSENYWQFLGLLL